METPVLKNSRDLWNLVCDVCAKSCPKAAYFRVWIEMDFILDDIWIVTSRSRWVPTWRTSWFRMVRGADENYLIRRGESTMMNLVWRLPVVTLRLQTAPDQREATFQTESKESFPPDFLSCLCGQNCHFLKKKQFWLNSTEQSVGALQGKQTLKSHGSNPSHWDPILQASALLSRGVETSVLFIRFDEMILDPERKTNKIWFEETIGKSEKIWKIWKNTVFLVLFFSCTMLVSNIGSYHGSLFVSGLFLRLTPQPRAEVG